MEDVEKIYALDFFNRLNISPLNGCLEMDAFRSENESGYFSSPTSSPNSSTERSTHKKVIAYKFTRFTCSSTSIYFFLRLFTRKESTLVTFLSRTKKKI